MRRVRTGREIDAALRKKGFLCDPDGDHIHYYFLSTTGRKTAIKTKMSHGMKGSTLSAKLISDMAHQLHLTTAQFLDFIDCHLDEAAYRAILQEQGETV